jgi:transcriptional regulator with XRE-family HTH domain
VSSLSDALNEANVDAWSAREIARRGGDRVHHGTVAKYLNGSHGRPGEEVLQLFSEVLQMPMPVLRQLAGQAPGEPEPWTPPGVANRLDRRQRRVLDELIYMLAGSAAREEGDGDDRDTTPMTGYERTTADVLAAKRAMKTAEDMQQMQPTAANDRSDEE